MQQKTNYYHKNSKQKYLIIALLVAIFILGIKVRTADYAQWDKHKAMFYFEKNPALTNSDGYYYLRLAQDLVQGKYKEIDERRMVGDDVKRPNPPPLLSIITAWTHIISGISLDKVAIFMPTILGSLIVFIIYFLTRSLGAGVIASIYAAFFSVLSIHFVTRTKIGFYDTDSLNVIFPLLESYFLLRFVKLKSINRYYYLVAGYLSFILFLIWWDQAIIVVGVTFILPLLLSFIFYFKDKANNFKLFTIINIFFIIALIILFKFGTVDLVYSFKSLFNDLFVSEKSSFPNTKALILELNPSSWQSLVDLSVNNTILFYLAILAIFRLFIVNFKNALFLLIPICFAIFPIYLGNRFAIYTGPIISIGIGLLVHYINIAIKTLISDYEVDTKLWVNFFYRVIIVFIVIWFGIKLYFFNNKNLYGVRTQHLFPVIKSVRDNISDDGVVWSAWTTGYALTYYSNKSVIIDGGSAINGERIVYSSIPLASNSQKLAANFIKFFTTYGIKGVRDIYSLFKSWDEGLKFIKYVLNLPPLKAKELINNYIKQGHIKLNSKFKNNEDILKFLFTKAKRNIYLLFDNETIKDGAWYEMGSWDIAKRKGTPSFFYQYHNIKEEGDIIKANNLKFNKKRGLKVAVATTKTPKTTYKLAYVLTHLGDKIEKIDYNNAGKLAFEWIKLYKYGAIMPIEFANSTFNQLFIHHSANQRYFKPIKLATPKHQIWQVFGDVYE